MQVTDARGQQVRTLAAGPHAAGRHELVWDGTDDGRQAVASGVYIVRLTATGTTDARKLLLLK